LEDQALLNLAGVLTEDPSSHDASIPSYSLWRYSHTPAALVHTLEFLSKTVLISGLKFISLAVNWGCWDPDTHLVLSPPLQRC